MREKERLYFRRYIACMENRNELNVCYFLRFVSDASPARARNADPMIALTPQQKKTGEGIADLQRVRTRMDYYDYS